MAQDIRKMLKEHRPEAPMLSKGHEDRFEARLAALSSEEKNNNHSFFWLKIAAVGILLLNLGYFGYQQLSNGIDPVVQIADNSDVKETPQFTLGDISPDLKKVEDFYLTGINVQLASLEITDENKDLMNGYMSRLEELNMEYTSLNIEMNDMGPSEATVTALIDNLKLRLELLFKLKNKLKELKNIDNEQFNSFNS